MEVVRGTFPRREPKEYQSYPILVWRKHHEAPLLPLWGAGPGERCSLQFLQVCCVQDGAGSPCESEEVQL